MGRGIAVATILISFNFSKISKKIPGSIVAILLTTVIVYFLDIPVATIESSYGEIPNRIPAPALPNIDFGTIQKLIQPAVAIALLGGIESLLSAVVSDGMIGGRHRSNMELVGQGIANCFSSIFGGIPATGAIARTATNVNNGGRTPVAGMVHAVVLLIIMLVLSPLAKLIPMACLAGILIVVAYHMSEWRQFRILLKGNRSDVLILLVTFFLTVIFDLVIAIEVGIILSSFILMKRMSDSIRIRAVKDLMGEMDEPETLFDDEIPVLPNDVKIFEIHGALFFGAAQAFQDTVNRLPSKPKVLILRMRNVLFIDATGIYRLKEIVEKYKQQNRHVILAEVKAHLMDDLEKGLVFNVLPKENVTATLEEAVMRLETLDMRR